MNLLDNLKFWIYSCLINCLISEIELEMSIAKRFRHWLPLVAAAFAVPAAFAPAAAAQEVLRPSGMYGDMPARAALPWAPDTIIYQVWLNCYGPQHALENAEKHLDDVARLGVTMIQLSPVHPHTLAAGPYSVDDYYGIDPAYGAKQDLQSYIEHAHRAGLKVIMDVVFVHTSPANPLMKEHPEFYARNAAGKVELSQWGLPHLNPANPDTRKYLIDNLLYWADDFGVDGFRADVASGMGPEFWNEVRKALDKAHPGLFLLAESTAPELMLQAFDASYGVSHMWTLFKTLGLGQPASEVHANWVSDRAKFPRGTLLLRSLDNHDQRRAVTEFGNRAAIAGMVINLTLDGIPFVYNGQEIGDPNPTPVHFSYPIWWQQERTAAVKVEGLMLHRGGYLGQDLDIYKKLIAIRKANRAFTRGAVEWVRNSDEGRIVSYLRTDGDQKFLVLVNVTNRPWTGTVALSPEDIGFHPLLAEEAEASAVPNNRLAFTLGPWGYYIGERNPVNTLP